MPAGGECRLRGAALLITLAAAVAAAPGAGRLAAQISPGELSAPHAHLEGSSQCLSCHEAKQGVSAARCLDCHELLGEQIAAGAGLHARPGYEDCRSCHIEHHGSDFELVWWGEEGMEAFDHRETGYALEGGHARLECRQCHRSALVSDPDRLRAQEKDLDRTFLGLERGTCLACHQDRHRGQFAAESCRSCHDGVVWKPAPGFDHQRSAFGLTGRHLQVACAECHRREGQGDDSFIRYAGIAFQSCSECHRDPHAGRLGAACESCHSTGGWQQVDRGRFDHDRTRYSLQGAHRRVECSGCHRGEGMRVARFENCSDCHSDVHLGQLAARPDGGACEGCHTVERFVPSTFDWRRHQESPYPLEGAHLAVPCDACHRRVAAAELPRPVAREPGLETIRFRFSSSTCLSCHGDSHRGEAARFVETGGCESCHSLESWRRVSFDHGQTTFPLAGAHREVGCRRCHQTIDAGTPDERLQMREVPTSCASCHQDVHLGQFAEASGPALCERCHTVDGWRPTTFSHDSFEGYRLEGAHRGLACVSCHPVEERGDQRLIRYRPLPTTCEGCHGSEAGSRQRGG